MDDRETFLAAQYFPLRRYQVLSPKANSGTLDDISANDVHAQPGHSPPLT